MSLFEPASREPVWARAWACTSGVPPALTSCAGEPPYAVLMPACLTRARHEGRGGSMHSWQTRQLQRTYRECTEKHDPSLSRLRQASRAAAGNLMSGQVV
jgi:hypothetical protein